MLLGIIFSIIIFYVSILLFLYVYGQEYDLVEEVDYIIILGAGLRKNKITNALKRRLDTAYEFAKDRNGQIIVSGGQGKHETCSEAKAMKQYLVLRGIEPERIIMENRSTSTYTNFLYCKHIIQKSRANVLIVTCDFHMFRSVLIGEKFGFTCYRMPAESVGLSTLKDYTRECLCLIKYVLIKK